MSENNGVVRVGRKGLKKFAFGEDGKPFTVDVVVAFQGWLCVDDEFREREGCKVDPDTGGRSVRTADMPEYHQAAVDYVKGLALGGEQSVDQRNSIYSLTVAEALEFIALLREEYDKLLIFFQPKSPVEPDSPDTSEAGLRFSEEAP